MKVEALSFSCDGNYLASVGGQDDGKLVVWDVQTGKAVCGSPVPVDYAQTVKFFNNTEDKLVTAGGMKITVWDFQVAMRLLKPTETNLGRMRRTTLSIVSFVSFTALFTTPMRSFLVFCTVEKIMTILFHG